MSEQEKLPACALCGHEPACTPAVPERLVCCTHSGCMCAGWDMPETMWRRLMAPPYEAIDGSDVVTIAVPASSIPAGATLRECYETDSEVIVIGAPDPDDENHNCDAMGCGSTGHVLYRLPKARPRLAPEHVASLRDMLNFCQEYTRDHPIPRAIRAALAALGEE